MQAEQVRWCSHVYTHRTSESQTAIEYLSGRFLPSRALNAHALGFRESRKIPQRAMAASAESSAAAFQYDPKSHGLREDFVLTKFTKVRRICLYGMPYFMLCSAQLKG